MKIKTNYKAFTLAETLITLAIIGVVAALVIPVTISKINKLQVETSLPVAYQNLKQIITAAEQDEGPMEEWNINKNNITDVDSINTFVREYLAPYAQGARYEYITLEELGYEKGLRFANGEVKWESGRRVPALRLMNGMIAIFGRHAYWAPWLSTDDHKVVSPTLAIKVYVDINGLKKPNMVGKDIFIYDINYDISEKQKFIMYGEARISTPGDTPSEQAFAEVFSGGNYSWWHPPDSHLIEICYEDGEYCGAWIARNGWKIPEHYPWL